MKSITLDREGYFVLQDQLRLQDEDLGRNFLENLKVDTYGVTTLDYDSETYIVEPFNKPYVARQVHLENGDLMVQMPYHLKLKVKDASLCVDAWDRFHGLTETELPFVLSRTAQAELFNLAEAFDDDSLTLHGKTWSTAPYYMTNPEVSGHAFWDQAYQDSPSPGWNLEKPHPELVSALPQIKLHKSRVLVPGCGYGHDAAHLAQQGHMVTAVDISDEALRGASERYGHIENLNFVKANVFDLGSEALESFDLIFEHTCYCAIAPDQRLSLLKAYRSYLASGGHLLGIFFVVPKRQGPYFGSSEWEIQKELEKDFRFLYWNRLKHSPDWRLGAELLVYAQKKDST